MKKRKIGLFVTMCSLFAMLFVGIISYKTQVESNACFDYFKRVSMKKCVVVLDNDYFSWTGAPIKPTVKVLYNGLTLNENVDYTVTYMNNTNAGTAKVKVKGIGNYRGSQSKTFTIKGIDLENDCTYTFDSNTKKFTIYYQGNIVAENNYSVTPLVQYVEKAVYGGSLVQYEKITTYTVCGKGEFSGSFTYQTKELDMEYEPNR